jgi:hypothetical protein
MPFVPVPFSVAKLGDPGAAPLPAGGGQLVAGRWPIGIPVPPKPGELYELTSVSLPVCVTCHATLSTNPNVVNLTTSLKLSGTVVYQKQQTVDLLTLTLTPPWVGCNALADDSITNPIDYWAGATLEVGYQLSFDLDISGGEAYCTLAGFLNNPAGFGGGTPTPTPGSIGYTERRL